MEKDGISTDPGYLEWASVAVFKKACKIFGKRGYCLRLLSAAFRSHMHWSARAPHDFRPVWLADSSRYDSFIHYISPILYGAQGGN
jgi:hypothetical protein